MRHALAQIGGVLQRMFASKIGGILSILVIGIAISLPAGMYVMLKNAQGLVSQLSGSPQISLFLRMDAAPDDIDKLRDHLAGLASISRSEFVSRDQALQHLKDSTGLADVIGGLKQNPLPHAFVVYPRSAAAQTLEELKNELAKQPMVELAQLDSAWAYKLEALLNLGRIAVLILAGLLSVALIAITFNTIRLQILTQRDEIEVARLIGATNGFIRRPFLYFGAIQGLLGGGMAWLILTLSILLLNLQIEEVAQLYASQFSLNLLSLGDSLTVLLFSMYLGWLGAWLSVTRHLSKVEAR